MHNGIYIGENSFKIGHYHHTNSIIEALKTRISSDCPNDKSGILK